MSVFGNESKLARIKEQWGYIKDVKWLIAQVELVGDLTKKRKSDAARNALVEEENARLRVALEFYANEDNYSYTDVSCPEVLVVGGEIACEALYGAKNE